MLGWDPAFRTGCKLAVVDADRKGSGYNSYLSDSTDKNEKDPGGKGNLKKMIGKYHVSLISLGNGTASRESEQVIVASQRDSGKGAVCDHK